MKSFLTDQVCLVTDGAQGIGWAISHAAAKAAIDGYTQTLHIELKGSPVNVTLVRLAKEVG